MFNPYDAPKAQNLSSPPELKKGAVWIAVLAGAAVDIIGTVILGALFGLMIGYFFSRQGMSPAELQRLFGGPGIAHPITLLGEVLGLLVSYYAGIICCRLAGLNARKAVAALAILMTLFAAVLSQSSYPLWHRILMSLLTTAVYYLAYRSFSKAVAIDSARADA